MAQRRAPENKQDEQPVEDKAEKISAGKVLTLPSNSAVIDGIREGGGKRAPETADYVTPDGRLKVVAGGDIIPNRWEKA